LRKFHDDNTAIQWWHTPDICIQSAPTWPRWTPKCEVTTTVGNVCSTSNLSTQSTWAKQVPLESQFSHSGARSARGSSQMQSFTISRLQQQHRQQNQQQQPHVPPAQSQSQRSQMQPRTISLGRQTQDPAPIGAAGAENSVPIEAINPEALSPFNSQRLEAGQKAPQHAASLCVLSSPIVQHIVVGGSVRIETANAGSSVRTDAASSAAPLSPKRFDTGLKPSQQAASPCVQSSPIMQHRAVAGGSVCVEAASLVAPFSPKRLESGQKSPQQASSPSVPNSPIMQHRLVGASYPDPQRSSGEPRAALAPATNVRSNIEPLAPRQESSYQQCPALLAGIPLSQVVMLKSGRLIAAHGICKKNVGGTSQQP